MSLVFTVRELDAGPIIANEQFEVDDQIKVCVSLCSTENVVVQNICIL